VELDYIHNFSPVDVDALFKHLLVQAEKSGVRGIHLVDEAAPPVALIQLALLNRQAGLPLVFWGNIRFEKTFTPDSAALLAAGGLIGVSAGIEVASESGFKRIGKGIGLAEVVNACAAFKEAGILTHAYLIYGYWDETKQEIIDSAETLRQLFQAELLDSAFWHQFSLTKHSRIYAEKLRGMHPGLKVLGDLDNGRAGNIFALNDLSFEGEEQFAPYAAPLDQLLASWMKGECSAPVQSVFPFKVPKPLVSPELVAGLVDRYARDRNNSRIFSKNLIEGKRVLFLGSRPFIRRKRKGEELRWTWRLEEYTLRLGEGQEGLESIRTLLEEASKSMKAADFYQRLEAELGKDVEKIWRKLREGGLNVK
jgi:hypothetical protein